MHFEDRRGGSRATSEGLWPSRAFYPCPLEGLWLSALVAGEEGVRACPSPSAVFLAFRVTLRRHSAKSVCCSLSSAPWVCPEPVRGPSVGPEVNLPKHQYWMFCD